MGWRQHQARGALPLLFLKLSAAPASSQTLRVKAHIALFTLKRHTVIPAHRLSLEGKVILSEKPQD